MPQVSFGAKFSPRTVAWPAHAFIHFGPFQWPVVTDFTGCCNGFVRLTVWNWQILDIRHKYNALLYWFYGNYDYVDMTVPFDISSDVDGTLTSVHGVFLILPSSICRTHFTQMLLLMCCLPLPAFCDLTQRQVLLPTMFWRQIQLSTE